jgi:hypothetical protein
MYRSLVITWFGVGSVSLMLIAYALEARAPMFVLLFAGACAGSSVYGFLAGAWPFGVVEAVWTGVALRRWRVRTRPADSGRAATAPIACDMTALSPAERRRYDGLRRLVLDAVEAVTSRPDGFTLRLRGGAAASDVAEWMSLEHRCCPFLTLQLVLDDDGTTSIGIGGSTAIKAFVQDEFRGFVPHGTRA